jgi:hypothetical protein
MRYGTYFEGRRNGFKDPKCKMSVENADKRIRKRQLPAKVQKKLLKLPEETSVLLDGAYKGIALFFHKQLPVLHDHDLAPQ